MVTHVLQEAIGTDKRSCAPNASTVRVKDSSHDVGKLNVIYRPKDNFFGTNPNDVLLLAKSSS